MSNDEQMAESILDVAAIAISHSAMFVAMFDVLEAKGLFQQSDVDDILHCALTGLENAKGGSPLIMSKARRTVEGTMQNLRNRPRGAA